MAAFKERSAEFDETTGTLSARCGDGIEGLEGEVGMANGCMKRMSRVMNSVLYTLRGRYDQDYYGAEYVKPIPVLRGVSGLTTLDSDSEEYKSLMTRLVRAKNMVSNALEGATWIADYGVESLGV